MLVLQFNATHACVFYSRAQPHEKLTSLTSKDTGTYAIKLRTQSHEMINNARHIYKIHAPCRTKV